MTAPGSLTRRTVLRRGGGALALGITGIAAVPAIASTPDDGEIVALYAEYQAAEAEWDSLNKAMNDAQGAWYASADHRRGDRIVTLWGHECFDEDDIEAFACDDDERDAAVAALRRKLAASDTASAQYGVPQAEAAEEAAAAREGELLERVADAPANTLEGVAIKLRLIVEEARIEGRETSERLAETALATVERLMGGTA